MRIVVTGATGNVGSALLRSLVAAGEHDLGGVARRTPEAVAPFDQVQWFSVDLATDADRDELRRAVAGADAVVHLAWGFQPTHDGAYLRELGVGGTRRVIDAVVDAGVPHLVHMSSVGAYSPKHDDTPVDESWPTEGIPGSMYSRHKATAERLLDSLQDGHPDRVVTRLRPGIVGQRSAGSALLRYALPAVVPARALDWLPVLPLDRALAIPMVHADDVASAIVRVLDAGAPGPFNLSASPPLTVSDIAEVLTARHLQVPAAWVRAAVSVSWHARVQQLDPGWIDLAYAVPLLDTGRASAELGWSPQRDAVSVLTETVSGMRDAATDRTAVLRPRTVGDAVGRFVRRGPVSSRRRA